MEPIFFVQIGIDTHLRALGHPRAIVIASLLVASAIVGKLIAEIGAHRQSGRLLVGTAMIPHGEVELLLASVGLSKGILDVQTHAMLVLVVLVTSLVGPAFVHALLKRRETQG